MTDRFKKILIIENLLKECRKVHPKIGILQNYEGVYNRTRYQIYIDKIVDNKHEPIIFAEGEDLKETLECALGKLRKCKDQAAKNRKENKNNGQRT